MKAETIKWLEEALSEQDERRWAVKKTEGNPEYDDMRDKMAANIERYTKNIAEIDACIKWVESLPCPRCKGTGKTGYWTRDNGPIQAHWVDKPCPDCIKENKYMTMTQRVTDDGKDYYVSWHPDLPGCMSHGDTPEESQESLDGARQDYIATLIEDGQPIPKPQQYNLGDGMNFTLPWDKEDTHNWPPKNEMTEHPYKK